MLGTRRRVAGSGSAKRAGAAADLAAGPANRGLVKWLDLRGSKLTSRRKLSSAQAELSWSAPSRYHGHGGAVFTPA